MDIVSDGMGNNITYVLAGKSYTIDLNWLYTAQDSIADLPDGIDITVLQQCNGTCYRKACAQAQGGAMI
jgi:hypothetical protein